MLNDETIDSVQLHLNPLLVQYKHLPFSQRVIEQTDDPPLPAAQVQPVNGKLVWLYGLCPNEWLP